jgi:hypothetical protein
MYNEPDWSSLSVAELLEKAQEFAKRSLWQLSQELFLI